MAEFVARLGLIALNNSTVSGSLTVTNGITGSLFGTASWSTNALTSSFVPGYISGSGTTNYVSKFTAGGIIGSSQIFDDGVSSIGIGTSSPTQYTGYSTLELSKISGSVLRLKNDASSGVFEVGATSTLTYVKNVTATDLWFGTNNTERLRITSAGNVGIGTTSPSAKLEVRDGNLAVSKSSGEVDVFLNTGGVSYFNFHSDTQYGLYSTDYGSLFIRNKSTGLLNIYDKVYVTSGGNVGIGGTTPNRKLEVITGNGTTNGIRLTYANNVTTEGLDITYLNNGFTTASFDSLYNSDSALMQFRMKTAATPVTAMTILGSGNVGIGTTSPGAILDVYTTGDPTAFFRAAGDFSVNFRGSTLGNTQLFSIRNNNTSVVHLNTQNSARLALGVSAATGSGTVVEHVTINSSGNVGIGTTSPNYKLEVNSGTSAASFRALSTNTSSNRVFLEAQSGSVEQHFLYTGNQDWVLGLDKADSNKFKLASADDGFASAKLTVTTAGNVGIGTTSPTNAKLVIAGTSAGTTGAIMSTDTAGTTSFLRFLGDASSQNLVNWQTGSALRFATSNQDYSGFTERLRIDSSGNLGIGTTSPSTRLHISASTGGVLEVDGAGTAGANALYVSASGNVGVGTASPSEKLHVVGNILASDVAGAYPRFISTVGAKSWEIGYRSGTTNYEIREDGTTRLVIANGGNVGIGTTSPNTRLSIIGNVDLRNTAAGLGSNYGVELSTNSNTPRVSLVDNGVYSGEFFTVTSVVGLKNIANAPLTFGTNNIERARFSADGNFGIGTTSPNAALTVLGSSGDTTSNRDIAVFAENSGIFIDDAGTTNSRLGLVKKAGFSPAIAAGSTTILSLGHWSTVNLLGNIRTGSFTADLSIATNGNVGIGTSTPSYKLDVTGTGQFRSSTVNSGSTPAGIFLSGDDKDAIWRSGLKVQHSSDVAITAGSSIGISLDPLASTSSTFYGSAAIKAIRPNATANNQDTDLAIFTRAGASNSTTDTEKMRITAGGNVGIGVTNPASYTGYTTLAINNATNGGLIDFMSNGTVTGRINNSSTLFGINAVTAIPLVFYTTATERMRIDSSGNIAVGVTSADTTSLRIVPVSTDTVQRVLHIGYNGSMSSGTHGSLITFGNTTPSTAQLARIGAFYEGGTYMGSLRFYTNTDTEGASPSERMRITAGGNVGIGTTSPSTKLHVVGQTYITDDLLIRGTHNPYASSNRGVIALNGTGGNIISFASATTTHGYMFVTSTNYEFVTVANQNFIFYNGGTEALRITNAGNVGIGSTSPSVRLQVNGSTLITGSLTVGQSTTGSSEHTLTVGVPLAAGAGEGGQILLAASGGLYTSASMLDNYQNSFRILRGTNAGSDAAFLNLNLHSGQLTFNKYTGSGAFSGTAAANLAVDSSGNVITVATGGGGGGSVTINNNVDNYLITATGTANTLNGEANLQFNGSTLTVTGGLTVITGSAIELQVTNTGVNIGNAFTDVHRITGSLNMPYTASGVIILDDPKYNNVYPSSDNYTQPQIRIRGESGVVERTGISILKNQEIHLVSSGKGVFATRTISGIARAIMANDVWLEWTAAETDAFVPDTTIKRIGPGVLEVTSSIKAQSFTGSLQGTSSWAVSASWAPSAGGSAPTAVTFNRVTTSYTLVLSDAGKTIEMNASAAGTYNITVPPASSVNFADGTFIDVVLYGSGSIQFVTGSGVTFRSANNWTKLSTRYGAATLINIAGDEWYLIGNLNP